MRLLLLLALPLVLGAQSINVTPVSPSSLGYYSYSSVSPISPPLGAQVQLDFPNQAAGGQLTIPACSTYANLQYNHYNYNSGTAGWDGPVTGPVYGYFTKFYASQAPSGQWGGIQANVSMEGAIASNSSPTTQTYIQAVYFSTDNCYEYGPEVGFYKLLQHPNTSSEHSTVVFYYGINVNCYNVGPLGSCRNKSTGASLQYNVATSNFTIPDQNSAGGTNFIYTAYLSDPTHFFVSIVDPYTLVPVAPTQAVNVAGFFADTANVMFTQGLSGYVTATQQRNSILGGITESMINPLKLTVYGLAALALANSPRPAQGRQALNGWCQKGATTVYAPPSSGSTPAQKAYQQSFPSCTVTVYNAGTLTPAPIYSDNSGTAMSNPFTATTSGLWQFFADNGVYDVKYSGAGIASPFTVSRNSLFDFSTWIPVDFYASHSIGVYGAGTSPYVVGFTAPSGLAGNRLWQLPAVDQAGCLQSNGLLQLQFGSCSPGGVSGTVQYNSGGAFAGDNNFTWDSVAQSLSIVGKVGTPAIRANTGFIQAQGFFSTAASWQGFNTNTDGALLRGLHLAADVPGTRGGYINAAPLGYANLPQPLPGLSAFGNHTGLWWVSATNDSSPDNTVAWNTNLFVNAAGGLAVCPNVSAACGAGAFNSIQAPNAGVFAKSLTVLNYVQSGNAAGIPALTTGDSFQPGALYYDTNLGFERVYNGSTWVALGSGGGGGGTPGGNTKTIQYNGSGSFAGSDNLYWENSTHQLVITTTGVTAGLVTLMGFIQSEAGFLAQNVATPSTALAYNVIQTPQGGMAAKSFTATKYIQSGSSAGAPALTTSDAFHAGALYWDTGSNAEQVYNGTSWISLGGGTGTPGGATTNVQYNSAGAFAGSANFTFSSATRLLTITTADAAHAGVAVASGFIQADAGFLATVGTATNFNAIQAPGGGMLALSFTASKYVQTGNGAIPPSPITGDTLHAGALFWNTASTCEQVYNGTSWACLGSGGSGTPAGPSTAVQFNNSGSFGGSSNFVWNDSTKLLTVFGVASTAGIAVANGYIQSDQGFLVNTSTAYNSVQTTGGMAGRSFTATTYVQTGSNASAPTATTSDTIHAGAVYWDTSAGAEKVFDGSAWQTLATSTGGVSAVNLLTGSLILNGVVNQTTTNTSGLHTLIVGTVQDIATTSNVTFASLTAGPVQSTASGASVAFQTTNFNIQMTGNGNISSAGQINLTGGGASSYKMGGTVFVDSARNGTFAVLTASGNVAGANFTAGAGGVFQSGATGATTAFQTTNFNFQVNGNGAISGQQLNIGGLQVIDTSRNITNAGSGTFSSAVTMNGGMNAPIGTNSTLNIGSGNFYLRTFSGGDASCGGVQTGWIGYRTDTSELQVCNGGGVRKVTLP